MYAITLYLFHLMGCISLNEALFGIYVDAWILIIYIIGRKLHDKYILDSSGNEELIPSSAPPAKKKRKMTPQEAEEYFAEQKGFDPNKIVTVAITPCTAKKLEAKEYTLNIDYVLTASELSILFKEENVKFADLEETEFDKMLGESSGSGMMFGTTGGVCESVIRTLYRIMVKKNLEDNELIFNELRGYDGIKEATIQIDKYKLRVAVVQQMENLEKLLENDKYKNYHFIEVMNCKGGCVGGGGQPLCAIPKSDEIKEKRSKGLQEIDQKRVIRCSHDNKELKELYKEYLK